MKPAQTSPGPAGGPDTTSALRARLARATGATVAAALVLAGCWVGVGLLITGSTNRVGGLDLSVARWMVDHRTPLMDDLTRGGTFLGQTLVKVIVTAVAAAGLVLGLRSWRAASFVVLATVLEGAVFLAATTIVGRPRPDVPRLEDVTVNSSFPSGHTGAAAAYAAIAVVILGHVHRPWVRALTVVLAVLVPVAVALSRMYRGAHYLTDVVAGGALGWACVAVAFVVVRHWFGAPAGTGPAAPR